MANTTTAAGFNYPHRVLTPIKDTPGYSSLQKLQKKLYASAQAMHSNAGGGNHGHIALVMPDADYLALAGERSLSPSTLESCLFMHKEQLEHKSQKLTGNMMPILQPTCATKKFRQPYGNKF
jgi:hypothetical protein